MPSFLLVALWTFCVPAAADPFQDTLTSLVSGQRIEREMKGAGVDYFTITLRQGQYLHVLIDQVGIDVVAKLSTPSGAEVVKTNLYGEIGPESISYLALESGDFRLEVRAFQPRVIAGRYRLVSFIKDDVTPRDKMQISAERLTNETSELMDTSARVELKRALELGAQSVSQWRQLNDKYWLAYALNNLGAIFQSLDNRVKAVENLDEALSIRRTLKDQLGEAQTLYTIAKLHSRPEERSQARSFFTQALSLFKKAGNRAAVAYTLVDIGRTYHDQGKISKAIEHYQKALAIARSSGYVRQEAVALTDIAVVYARKHQTEKALPYYEQAIPIWRAANDKNGEAMTWANIGYEYSAHNNHQQALDYYQKALAIYQTLKADDNQSWALNQIADTYLALDQKEKAIEFYRQSSELNHNLGNQQAEANALIDLSKVFEALGNSKEELQYRLQGAVLLKSLGNRDLEAENLEKIGDAYFATEDYQSAGEYYQQALALLRTVGNRGEQADVLYQIGLVTFALNDKKRALTSFNDALSIYRSVGDHAGASLTLTIMGMSSYFLGDKDTAWKYFTDALPLLQHQDVSEDAAEHIIGKPMVLVLFEDYQSAAMYYEEVMKISKVPSRQKLRALALVDFSTVLSIQGESHEALIFLREAQELYRKMDDHDGEATVLNAIGDIYLTNLDAEPDQKETDPGKKLVSVNGIRDAAKMFEEALSISRSQNNPLVEAKALNNLCGAQQMLGNRTEATTYCQKALTLATKHQDSGVEASSCYRMMKLWDDLSNPQLAIIYGKRAINSLQSVRAEFRRIDRGLEKAWVQLSSDPYRELASLLVKQGRLLEAEQVLEMLKEEEFFRFIRRDDEVAKELLKRMELSAAERGAVERYEKIADQIVGLGDEYDKLEAQRLRLPVDKTASIIARQDEINNDLASARKTLSLFLEQLKKEFGDQDKRVAAVEEGLQAEVKSWNEPHTVVMSTIVGRDSLTMILTTSQTQRAFIIDKIEDKPFTEEVLNALIAEFRAAARDINEDPRPSGQRLYDLLIRPLEKDLQAVNANTIVWSLDSNLRYLPIAALYDSHRGYLAERYASVIITLASRNNLDSQPIDQSRWQALGLGVSKPVGGFPPLGNVPEELRAIVRDTEHQERTGLLQGHRLLDEQFTMAAFKLNLGRYNVIHAATHFSFRVGTREESLQSFLLLGNGEKLTLAQVKDAGAMFSGVELLVLSACDTAAGGKGSDGREIEGLGVLAQKAGAKTVIATLWPVADPSTRELMVTFYELHGTIPNISKAEALRRAQLTLLRGGLPSRRSQSLSASKLNPSSAATPYAHPYYWAPFILIGNWK